MDDRGISRTKVTKSHRKSFNVGQLLALECQYSLSRYLRGQQRQRLAKALDLTDTQVKVWFQNRRAKESRQITTTGLSLNLPNLSARTVEEVCRPIDFMNVYGIQLDCHYLTSSLYSTNDEGINLSSGELFHKEGPELAEDKQKASHSRIDVV